MTQPPFHSALLLTAGLGHRLAPLTEVRAKPAVPVAGQPLVARIARWLAGQGVTDLVLNLHHLPSTITAIVGDGSDLGARVRYSWEQPLVLGTAGGPRQALPIIGGDTFFVINGDTLADVDLAAMAARHTSSHALVTLAVTPNVAPLRYGGLLLDHDARVVGVMPRGPAAANSFHFVGVQIVQAEAFASAEAGRPLASIGGVYDDLIAARPGSIVAFVSDGAFWDVGTVSDYWETSLAFIDREGRGWHGRAAQLDPSARVDRSILWDHVEVGARAVLDECIVTDRVRVPDGASYQRRILHMDAADRIVATPFRAD